MALYRGLVTKQVNGSGQSGKWTNVYTLQAATPEAAMIVLNQVVLLEKELYYEPVVIIKQSVQNPNPEGTGGRVQSVSVPGERGVPGDPLIPLWNVCRVDFQDDENAYQERKYLRGMLTEADFQGSVLEDPIVALLDTYGAGVVALSGVVTPQGNPQSGSVSFLTMFNRQTGWSRKARPGFHRAYVPNS